MLLVVLPTHPPLTENPVILVWVWDYVGFILGAFWLGGPALGFPPGTRRRVESERVRGLRPSAAVVEVVAPLGLAKKAGFLSIIDALL